MVMILITETMFMALSSWKVNDWVESSVRLMYKTNLFTHCFSGVTRICCEERQRLKLCHGALTADFRAGCSSCSMTNSFVTNAVLIETAVSCWHLFQLISQTIQYLDSWLSDLLQSELNIKLLEVEGGEACAPVPHSWRRHCVAGLYIGPSWPTVRARFFCGLSVCVSVCPVHSTLALELLFFCRPTTSYYFCWPLTKRRGV